MTNVSCSSSPSSSEKLCMSHEHPMKEQDSFMPGLMLGEAEMTISVTPGLHLVCAKCPSSPFGVSAAKAPWSSVFFIIFPADKPLRSGVKGRHRYYFSDS